MNVSRNLCSQAIGSLGQQPRKFGTNAGIKSRTNVLVGVSRKVTLPLLLQLLVFPFYFAALLVDPGKVRVLLLARSQPIFLERTRELVQELGNFRSSGLDRRFVDVLEPVPNLFRL